MRERRGLSADPHTLALDPPCRQAGALEPIPWLQPPAGQPAVTSARASAWLQVDDAAAYMGHVSRKVIYAAVKAGLRVARLGDAGPSRDARGRLRHGRMVFNTQWIDEFLEARARHASVLPPGEREADHGNPLNQQALTSMGPRASQRRLQRRAEHDVAEAALKRGTTV